MVYAEICASFSLGKAHRSSSAELQKSALGRSQGANRHFSGERNLGRRTLYANLGKMPGQDNPNVFSIIWNTDDDRG